MLKRVIASFCVLLLVFIMLFFSIEDEEPARDMFFEGGVTLEATIIEVKDTFIYVSPDDDSYDADKYRAAIPEKDRTQNFQKGNKVQITFSGKVNEVYPPALAKVTDIQKR